MSDESGLTVEAVAWLPYVDHEGKTVHAVSVDAAGARRWHVSQALISELQKSVEPAEPVRCSARYDGHGSRCTKNAGHAGNHLSPSDLEWL